MDVRTKLFPVFLSVTQMPSNAVHGRHAGRVQNEHRRFHMTSAEGKMEADPFEMLVRHLGSNVEVKLQPIAQN
jgi:hypothetical protein